ncbi:MAG: TM2 domain-containing protein [Nanoarchaeota archaeon]|mgnify:CR=1 FL=1
MADKNTALILSILLGYLGVDRFYLGKIGTGILKLLLTAVYGAGLIWWVVDIFLIATDKMTDKNGKPLKK